LVFQVQLFENQIIVCFFGRPSDDRLGLPQPFYIRRAVIGFLATAIGFVYPKINKEMHIPNTISN
jgi:hypothetical protein